MVAVRNIYYRKIPKRQVAAVGGITNNHKDYLASLWFKSSTNNDTDTEGLSDVDRAFDDVIAAGLRPLSQNERRQIARRSVRERNVQREEHTIRGSYNSF